MAQEVVLLRHFADGARLSEDIDAIARAAPFRHLRTRGGRMSVAMTNCGHWGWHSDEQGYRYVERDPATGQPWPPMPPAFVDLAGRAAERGGFPGFEPDCCLINRYAVGAQMGAHRDFDELDLRHPIVSVSIGLPAIFVWYGAKRTGVARPVPLVDGDVLVWGGSARAGYHAVRRLTAAPEGLQRPLFDGPMAPPPRNPLRFNLTFRRAR